MASTWLLPIVIPDGSRKRPTYKSRVHRDQKLPVNERIVVVLFYVENILKVLSARFLEVPLTTVAKRLYSARIRLRAY